MASSIHQSIKIRVKELIHTILTGWLWIFNWIHFLKEIAVYSNFFSVFCTIWSTSRIYLRLLPFMYLHSQHNQNNLYAQQLACKKGFIALMAYILSSSYLDLHLSTFTTKVRHSLRSARFTSLKLWPRYLNRIYFFIYTYM